MSSNLSPSLADGEASSGAIDLNADAAERQDLDVAAGGAEPVASCSDDRECGAEPSGAAEASGYVADHGGAGADFKEDERFPSSEGDAACTLHVDELGGVADGVPSAVQKQGAAEVELVVGEDPTTKKPHLEVSPVEAGIGSETVDGSLGESDQGGEMLAAGVSADVPGSGNTSVAMDCVEEPRSDSAFPATGYHSISRLEESAELEVGKRWTSASSTSDVVRLGSSRGGENNGNDESRALPVDEALNHETEEGQSEDHDDGDSAEENGTENSGQDDEIKEELSKKSEKHSVKHAITRCEASLSEIQQVDYCFPREQKDEFSVSDLVWGKVKSHPWWPGQIIDPSFASELALKYQRKDNFLVAYFGDKTFAWCDESQLKSFAGFFSQMEKQSGSDAFSDAVNSALTEASRRVEWGMACSCVPEEVYHSFKIQKIENSGIREGVAVSLTDKSFGLSSFRPDHFVEYIRALARFPTCSVDGFDLTIAKAQLMAYYRSRGYTSLPEFFAVRGLLESSSDTLPSEDMVDHSTPTPRDEEKLSALVSGKLRPKSGAGSQLKHKNISEDGRKQKRVSDLMEVEKGSQLENGREPGAGKKHKSILAVPSDSERSKKKRLDKLGDLKIKSPAPTLNKSFMLGECISRAASKLTSSPSVLKSNDDIFSKSKSKADFGEDSPFSLDDSILFAEETQNIETSFSNGYASPGKMLSWLGLAAIDPLKEYDFLTTVISFFSGFLKFRDSDSEDITEPSEQTSRKRGRKKSISGPRSSEDLKPLVEVKRKRGRPRSNPAEDMTSPEEVKCRRGRPKSNTAVGKNTPEEIKRKRGRPRSTPAEDVNPAEEDKCKRGRPKLTSAEDMHPPVKTKRKRGRPCSTSTKEDTEPLEEVQRSKTLISKTDTSDMSIPDYMKDPYWTDVVIQGSSEKKRRGRKRKEEALMQSPVNTQSPTYEPYESQPLIMLLDIQKHNRVSFACPSKGSGFTSERPIKYFGEKCIEESNPTVLVLNFMDSNSLPSETDLVRIFSRFGPLKESETEVQKKMKCAKVVFKRRADAEVAFSAAGKFSFFGPSLLSFRLRDFPLASEKSPHVASEDEKLSPIANSSNFDVAGLKKDEALVNDYTMEVPEVILDQTSIDSKTNEALAGKNHDHMGRCQSETLGAEKGEMPIGNSEVCSTEKNEIETSCCYLENSASEKFQASRDVWSGDVHGQKCVEVALESEVQGYSRDGITATSGDLLVVSSMKDPALGDASGTMAQDNWRVVTSMDRVNVENLGNAEDVIPMQDENSEVSNSKGGPEAHHGSEGSETKGIRSDEAHVDGCNLNVLGNANVPVPTETCDMYPQGHERIEAPVTSAVLEVPNTKTDETETGDLEVLGMREDPAVTDVCNVTLRENQRDKSPIDGGNVEIQGIIKDGPSDGQTDPISVDICHLKCPNSDEVVANTDSMECSAIETNETIGQSGDLEVCNSVKESTTLDPSYVEVRGQKKCESSGDINLEVMGIRKDEQPENAGGLVVEDAAAVNSCSLEVQNARGGIPVDSSSLVASGASKVDTAIDDDNLVVNSFSEDATVIDSCNLYVQNAGGGNFPVDSSSLLVSTSVKVVTAINHGNLEPLESKNDPTSNVVCISEVPVSGGDEAVIDGHELKNETNGAPVCEEHVEASVSKTADVHMGDSKADDLIHPTNWEIPKSRTDVNPTLDDVPIGGGTLGVLDIRVDETTEAANSELLDDMQTSDSKTDDAPADTGAVEVPDGRVEECSNAANLGASLDRTDVAPKDHLNALVCKTENVSEGREKVATDARTDAITIAYLEMTDTRNVINQVFDKHQKASGCEIDDIAQGGGKELLSTREDENIDADKLEIPVSGIDTPSKNPGNVDEPDHLEIKE